MRRTFILKSVRVIARTDWTGAWFTPQARVAPIEHLCAGDIDRPPMGASCAERVLLGVECVEGLERARVLAPGPFLVHEVSPLEDGSGRLRVVIEG